MLCQVTDFVRARWGRLQRVVLLLPTLRNEARRLSTREASGAGRAFRTSRSLRTMRFPMCAALLVLFASLSFVASPTDAYASRDERQRRHPEIFHFPYVGAGDPDHTFRHPYEPSAGGDPVDAWFQLGTTTISRGKSGRDVVRLTSASQANQGIFYNAIRTESNNFNGYFDIQVDTVRESHEAADGMGFFFTRDRPQLGSAMGITHSFQGLGLIVDTFSNSRTRHVPYLYAYVSDGAKEWNPDTDGSDTEVTRGCQLEMNTQVRVYIQYVDEELHVGVAMNPRSPQRWHTCFKATNVRLPFSGGGYLAFAGETGHFFAHHEVHDAVFIDESPHSGEGYRSEYSSQDYGSGSQSSSSSSSHSRKEEPPRAPPPASDPSTRIHKADNPVDSFSGSLDLQVYDVFNQMANSLHGLGDHEAEDTKMRLDGVRDVTQHLIKEMERQKTDLANVIESLRHLKTTAGDLTYTADKFSNQLRGMHSSMKMLREKADRVSESHDDIHSDVLEHHALITEPGKGKSDSNGLMIMFLVMQILLGAAVYFVNKMSVTSRKMGRMV